MYYGKLKHKFASEFICHLLNHSKTVINVDFRKSIGDGDAIHAWSRYLSTRHGASSYIQVTRVLAAANN